MIDLNKKYLHSASASTNKDHFRQVPELVQPESAPNVPECTVSETNQDSGKRPRTYREPKHRQIKKRCTPSFPNCKSFDFFYLKFDHSSYSNNLCKYSLILSHSWRTFINKPIHNKKKVIFCTKFWKRRVVKLNIKKVKRLIIWDGLSTTILKLLSMQGMEVSLSMFLNPGLQRHW